MAHMRDFPLNDLTHEFDTRHSGHAVTLPPGSVIEVHGNADWGVFNLGASVSRREGGVRLCGYWERSLGSSIADLPSAGPGPPGRLIICKPNQPDNSNVQIGIEDFTRTCIGQPTATNPSADGGFHEVRPAFRVSAIDARTSRDIRFCMC